MIVKAHPGTNVTVIDIYPGIESFTPLQHQLSRWKKVLFELMDQHPDGVHLICHSQGKKDMEFENIFPHPIMGLIHQLWVLYIISDLSGWNSLPIIFVVLYTDYR